MVRFAPPRLGRLVALALQARMHRDGLAPTAVGSLGMAPAVPAAPAAVAPPAAATALGAVSTVAGPGSFSEEPVPDDAAPSPSPSDSWVMKKKYSRITKRREDFPPVSPMAEYFDHIRLKLAKSMQGSVNPYSLIIKVRIAWKALSEKQKQPFVDAYKARVEDWEKSGRWRRMSEVQKNSFRKMARALKYGGNEGATEVGDDDGWAASKASVDEVKDWDTAKVDTDFFGPI